MTWVNFINFQRAGFTPADPESIKFQLGCQYLFTLLGSARVKAAQKNVDEIDTWIPLVGKRNTTLTDHSHPLYTVSFLK